MQHLTTPLAHLGRLESPTRFGRFRRVTAGLMAIALAATATLAPAQTIPRQPLADSTHTYRNWGTPPFKEPVCNAGFVLSGGQCVQLSSGAGATLLPLTVPAGQYTNQANYPLLLQLVGPDYCRVQLYLATPSGWVTALDAGTTDSNTNCFGSAIVPPNTTFAFGQAAVTAKITALANGATWADTGVSFEYPVEVGRVSKSASPSFETNYRSDCTCQEVTYDWRNNISGASVRTTKAIVNVSCPSDHG
jgi:hypothetical protein